MPADSVFNEVARTIVDAFDVDIQLWMGRAFGKLRETPVGASFANWAEANTIVFEGLLRVTSALVRRLPNDENLLLETVYTQLSRLPVEVRRAVNSDAPSFVTRRDKDDEGFFSRYEDAVKDLSDNHLAQVVRLDPHRLREWVNSPARVRPFLLTKWDEQDSAKREKAERSRKALNESFKTTLEKTDAAAGELAPKIGKFADWLERHGGKR